jgi:hypothetical protein
LPERAHQSLVMLICILLGHVGGEKQVGWGALHRVTSWLQQWKPWMRDVHTHSIYLQTLSHGFPHPLHIPTNPFPWISTPTPTPYTYKPFPMDFHTHSIYLQTLSHGFPHPLHIPTNPFPWISTSFPMLQQS